MGKKVNISVGTDIYSTFQNYSYRIGSAVAEIVDNSIASFRNNQKTFDDAKKNGLKVEKSITLVFDQTNRVIIVRDSAFGIELKDIERALKLKKPPKDTSGLNEFGMGLKTSAFWFGKTLKIITKSPKEKEGYEVSLDIGQLKKNITEVETHKSNAYKDKWKLNNGTIITLSGIYEKRDLSNSMVRATVMKLASKYRKDIQNNGIVFRAFSKTNSGKMVDLIEWDSTGVKTLRSDSNILKGEKLVFAETPRWNDENTSDGYGITIPFKIEYLGNTLEGKGDFFIRAKGSRSEGGFDLFRRGRIIEEKNREFITDMSGFAFQRINGSIELDKYPVSQSKDSFEWEGELFEKTKKAIVENPKFKELVKIAAKLRVRSANSEDSAKRTKNSYEDKLVRVKNVKVMSVSDVKKTANGIGMKHMESDSAHKVITSSGKEKIIYSRLVTDGEINHWMDIREKVIDGEIITVVYLDINHTFFNPFNDIKGNGTAFTSIMRLFVTYWAQAEIESMNNGEEVDIFRDRLSSIIERNDKND